MWTSSQNALYWPDNFGRFSAASSKPKCRRNRKEDRKRHNSREKVHDLVIPNTFIQTLTVPDVAICELGTWRLKSLTHISHKWTHQHPKPDLQRWPGQEHIETEYAKANRNFLDFFTGKCPHNHIWMMNVHKRSRRSVDKQGNGAPCCTEPKAGLEWSWGAKTACCMALRQQRRGGGGRKKFIHLVFVKTSFLPSLEENPNSESAFLKAISLWFSTSTRKRPWQCC